MEEFNRPEEKLFRMNSVRQDLLETAKWGKFLGIVGFVGVGILVVLSLGVMVAGSSLSQFTNFPVPLSLYGVIYLVFAALYFFPVYYLYGFAKASKRGIESENESLLEKGIADLRRLFKFMGIFTIVILSLYALILVIVVPILIFSI